MSRETPSYIDAKKLKQWVHDGSEIALLDIREHGQYGEEHLFYVVSAPYSRLEAEAIRLVPNRNVRMVLVGHADDALCIKAQKRLSELGYKQIHILRGGVDAWKKAGYQVFAGVNLPSKTFGELAEHAFNTPRISAADLHKKIEDKEDIVILDGRPFSEFKKMSIPTAMCCPNGELPLRIDDIVKNPETTIVVNCAGRTRSIIGAQTLINLGLPNKILALENGTQGWYLADFKLDHGKTNKHPEHLDQTALQERQKRAQDLAKKHDVAFVDNATVEKWLKEKNRTTFLCDVRTPEEYKEGTIKGAQHTPGGQLVQATDQYVGIKGARLVLIDQEGVRAPAMASWLAMLGWDVAVWKDAFVHNKPVKPNLDEMMQGDTKSNLVNADQISRMSQDGAVLIDLRPSMKYRESHIKQAIWTIRPELSTLKKEIEGKDILLITEDKVVGELAKIDLQEMGSGKVSIHIALPDQWAQVGLVVEQTPNHPENKKCIDYLFFVHDRHDGNKEAAKQYLAWEINLLAQIDEQEKAAFKLPH